MLTGCGQHLTVRAEAAVEDSALVGGDLDVADESGVAPDAQGVVGKTARADDLAVVRAPAEAGNLRARVDAVDASARSRVPEVDVAIIRTASGSEEVHVPGAPGESLDGRLVVGLGELGNRQGPGIPDRDKVVVATRGKLSAIRAPLQAADLRGVRDELGHLVLGDTDVVVEDEPAPGTSGQEVLVPAHDTNPCVVRKHAADLDTLGDIPDLHLACAKTHANVRSIS